MDWIVTTARTVEEAQSRALDLLGVDTADAEIQVIEEGKTGLFGRTKSEARVRARIKPKAPATKDDRRPSRGDRSRSRSKGGGAKRGDRQGDRGRSRSKGGSGSGKDDSDRGGRSSKGDGGGRSRTKDKDKDEAKSSSGKSGNRGGSDRSDGRDGGGRDGGGRDGGGRDGGGRSRSRGGSRQRSDRNDRNSRNNEDRVEMPVDEQRETLEAFVSGVAKAFDDDAKVTLVEEGTTLQAQVNGGDLGHLVGPKAATLQALEELSRTAMHRAAAGRRYHRIQVDVDDYRARRRDALVKFATDLAKTVADTGESKAMEPMGAADRKLIHDAVSDVDGVKTVSEGRDPRRYIVLLATDASDEEE